MKGRLIVLVTAVLLTVGLFYCTPGALIGPTSVSKSNVYLRNMFDKDPSPYLGRFIPEGLSPAKYDETEAAKLRCSHLLQVRKVKAGGTFDETFMASNSAAGNIGVPGVAGASGSNEGFKIVRAKYTLTEKVMVEPQNPSDFLDCCEDEPGGCTKYYIGEFYAGTGSIYYSVSEQSDFDADAAGRVKGIPGAAKIEVHDGFAWKQAVTFTDTYFAFKRALSGYNPPEPKYDADGNLISAPTPPPTAKSKCRWARNIPKTNEGQYFVGVSEWVDSEETARQLALTSAHSQVVRYLGNVLIQGGGQLRATGGDVNKLKTKFSDARTLHEFSGALARFVKDEKWCYEDQPLPRGGMQYKVRVLTLFPSSAQDGALTSIGQELQKHGIQLAPGQ